MVADVIQPFLGWISQHPGWALAIVFLISFSECLAIVGLFIPGTLLIFSIGAVVATGALELGPTLLCAIAGSSLGNIISFWLGRHFHQRLHVVWPFRRYPALLGRGTNFFHKHGGKSVFLSRFLGPVRPILPAVAGMLRMSPSRFLMIDIIAAIVWAPAFILPGVVFGTSLHLAAEVAGRLVVLLVLLLALTWFSLWLMGRLLRFIQPHTSAALFRLLEWSREHPHIRPIAGALLDPNHPEARGLAVLASLWIITSVLFAMILAGVLGNAPLAGVDHYIYHLLQGLRTPWADGLMVRITELGDGFLRNSIFIATLAWLAWTRHWSAAAHWFVSYSAVVIFTRGLKVLAHVPRPIPIYEGGAAFSFPSGHTSLSVALYGFLAVLIAGELPASRRWIPYGIAVLLVVPISFSRLYLGVHWFTDVLAGLALGLGWVTLLGVAYRRHPRPAIKTSGLIAVTIIAATIAATWHAQQAYKKDLELYSVVRSTTVISHEDWWNSLWHKLPTYRIDLEGSRNHPITVQWVGDLNLLKEQLQGQGWRRPTPVLFSSSLRWLAPSASIADLPVLPQVHDGRHEVLRMVKDSLTDNSLLILRLWDSDFEISNLNSHVWIGNVSRLETYSPIRFITVLRTSLVYDKNLDELEDDTEVFTQQKRQRDLLTEITQYNETRLPNWDGAVLLLTAPYPASQ